MKRIQRIGRDPTPAERGLRIALEESDFRDLMGRDVFASSSDMTLKEAWAEWARMTADEKEPWHQAVLDGLRHSVECELIEHCPPEEPGPGGGLPIPLNQRLSDSVQLSA